MKPCATPGAALVCVAAALLGPGCGDDDGAGGPPSAGSRLVEVRSPAFADSGTIPKRFTCSGADVSPPLEWDRLPARTKEIAVLVEDVDADGFAHWIVLGIPPGVDHFAEGRPPANSVEAENGFGDRGWGGPCPPEGKGPHRYVFAVYALDEPLGLDAGASQREVHEAIREHTLARGATVARFGR
jgi:Raf kinase inhibitor-like YbhB/YbcL family protein